MKRNLLKLLTIFLLCAIMVGALYACSPRTEIPDDGVKPEEPGDSKVPIDEKLTQEEAKAMMTTAMDNYKKMNSQTAVKEYFGIDLELNFKYIDYTVVPNQTTNIRAVIKGNFHLTDNKKSELFVELIDLRRGTVALGIYYYKGVLYTAVPNGDKTGYNNYYARELNLSSIGVALSGALADIDIVSYIGGIFTAKTGDSTLDGIFSALPLLLFDGRESRMTTYDEGDSRDYTYELKVNYLLNFLKNGIPGALVGLIGLPSGDISWEAFGLPNFDVILDGIFGFSLESLKNKKWPTMRSGLSLITERKEMTNDDGTKYKDYVYKGIGLSITTPETKNQKNQYAMNLSISPLKIGLVGEKVPINFSGLNLSSGLDNQYKEGGLLNLDLDASLTVENQSNTKITLGDILGTMLDSTVDLGSLKNLTINIPEQNTYEFNLKLKTDIDLFNSDKTKIEMVLYFQGKPFIKGVLIKDTLYLDLSALKDSTGQIVPNLKVSGVDVTKLLSEALGDAGMAFLDPNFVLALQKATDPIMNAEGDAAPALDIMQLLDIIVKTAVFPTPGEQKLMIFDFENDDINKLLKMFVNTDGKIGIEGVALSVDLYDILHSLTISLALNDQLGAKIKINSLNYFRTPDFEHMDIIMSDDGGIDPKKDETFTDVMTNREYNAEIGGNFTFGFNTATDELDSVIDLSGLVGLVADNLLENLGIYVKIKDSQSLNLTYKIQVNIDILNFANLEFALKLFAGKDDNGEEVPFAVIYYNGADDTMYLDLSNLSLLQDKLPLLNIIGKIPLLKVPNLGLRDILGTIKIMQDPTENQLSSNIELVGDPYEVMGSFAYNLFLNSSLNNFIKNEEGGESSGFDIMGLIGTAIGGINIDTTIHALTIEINKHILTALLMMLGHDIAMPEVNGYVKIQLIGVDNSDPQNGYFQVHLGILADNDKETEAISLNINLINKLKIYVGKGDLVSGFEEGNYTDINDFINNLKIGISLSGAFSLTSSGPTFDSPTLDALLGQLIQGLALRFNLSQFGIELEFELDGIIAIGIKEDADKKTREIDLDKLLKESSAQIILKEKYSGENVLGIYLKDDNLYLQLDYFGMENIGIRGVSKLVNDINDLIPPTNLEKGAVEGGHALTKPSNLASLDNPTALALEILVNSTGVEINLTKDVLAMLLGLVMGGEFPAKLKDTTIKLDVTNGINISLESGIEVFDLKVNLGGLKINLNDKLPEIKLPDVPFNMTESGMPKYLNVELEAELKIHSLPPEGESSVDIDLSPALKHLLPDADLNAMVRFLGVVDGLIKVRIEGSIDLNGLMGGEISLVSFKDSTFKLTLLTVENGKEKTLLTAIFSEMNLYIDTEIMNIGKVVIRDLENAFTDIENGGKDENAPRNSEGNNAFKQAKAYLDIMFQPGGVNLKITKELLIVILKLLDTDLEPFLEGIEVEINADLMINPLEVSLGFNIKGVEAGLSVKNLNIGFDQKIEVNTDGYQIYEKLTSIGVNLTGEISLKLLETGEGGIRFDYLIRQLLTKEGSDEPLIDLGFLLQILDGDFGGTIYYEIKAAIDLVNINNLNLGLILRGEDQQQILSLYILGDGEALDLYLDLSKLGLEKIKIKNVQGLVSAFTPQANEKNAIIPLGLPLNANGEVNDFDLFGANIILSIASDSSLQKAPIALNVTSAAFFALLSSFGIDLKPYLENFGPHLGVEIGNQSIINIDFGLDKLLQAGLSINVPDLSVNPDQGDYEKIKNDPEYYLINNNNSLRIKVELKGKLNLDNFNTGEDVPNKPDINKPIDLTDIIQNFFEGADFGVLIHSLFESRTTINYSISASLDIVSLAKAISEMQNGNSGAGNIVNGINALIYLSDENDVKLGSIYLQNGTVYIDLSKLNAGKIRIDNIGALIDGEDEISKTAELLAPLNEEDSGLNNAEQLAAFYISLVMSNSSGVMLTIFADVFRVILNTFDLPGDLITSAVNNVLEARLGIGTDGEYVQLQIDIASYKLDFRFSPIEINFQKNQLLFPEFVASEYKTVDVLGLNEVYVKLNLDLSWEMNEGTEISFKELLQSIDLDVLGMDLAPILTIFEELASTFRLQVEGIINFTDIFSSTLKLQLFSVVDGEVKDQVLSIQYINKDLYLDAECFNIQKVVIRNAIDYFGKLFGGGLLSTFSNVSDPDNSEAEKQVRIVSAYIMISYTPEALIANISANALIAVLQLAGLDVGNYIDAIGDPNIVLELLNAKNILDLSIILNAFKKDENGDQIIGVPDPDHAIKLKLAISKDFRVALAKSDIPTFEIPEGYAELASGVPVLGIHTTLVLDINTGKVANADLYQAPLDKLLGDMLAGIFADVILELSLILDIQDELGGSIELEIFANLNPLNLQALKMQINGYASNGVDRNKILQLNIYDGDLYVDLSPIHGPKFCIEELMETILGTKENEELKFANAEGDSDNEEDVENRPQLGIEAQISKYGLVIFARKAAFETLLGLFMDIDTIDMFGDLEARIKLAGIGNTIYLGVELEIDAPEKGGAQQDGDYMFKMGLGLEGLRVNFEPFNDETIITPQYQLYIKGHYINTVQVKTTLEISLNTEEGKLDIKELFEVLLKDNPLANTLPNKIFFEKMGDTLVVDVEAIFNVFDLLNSLQVRLKVYSKNSPETFYIDITYMKGDVYLDLSKINLGKVVIHDVIGIFGSLMTAESKELFSEISNLENVENPNVKEQMKRISATIKLLLNAEQGLLLNLSKDVFNLIFTALNLEEGLSNTLGAVIDTINPKLNVNFDPDLNFSLGLSINNADTALFGAKLALVGKNTYVNVFSDLEFEDPDQGTVGNLVPPIISIEERKDYIPYNELTVYADVNITFTLELDKGNMSIDEILNALVPGLQLNVQFKGNETIEIYIKGSIAIDFGKLLALNADGSRDLDKAKDAIIAHLNMGYALYDRDNKDNVKFFTQDILDIYIYNDTIYAQATLLGDKDGKNSTVAVKVEGLSITNILLSLFDGKGFPNIDIGDIIGNQEGRQQSNPYAMLFGMFNAEEPLEGSDKLESAIYLNSHGLTVVIVGELIQSLLEMLGVGDGMDLNALIKSVFTEGSLGLVVDNGFSIDITLTNDDGDPNKGKYRAKLSLLHGLKLTTIRKDYDDFYRFMTSDGKSDSNGDGVIDEKDNLLAFYASCFDIKQLNNRVSAGLRVMLDADFKKHILDWSELFKYEVDSRTSFYIVIAEAMRSTTYISLQIDLDFTNLTKMALDVVLSLEDQDKKPILNIYFDGNLDNPNFGSEGPKIYMESPSMGIGKVYVDFPMLGDFLAIDLMKLLNIKDMEIDKKDEVNSARNADGATGDEDLGFTKPDGSFDATVIGKILDSISINKGSLSVIIARTALASILNTLLGFPFSEIGEINLSLNFIENTLSLDFGLDVPHENENGELVQDLHFLVELGSINVHLGPNNIMPTNKDPKYFDDFVPLTSNKYELDAKIDLNISDKIGGVFDLTDLISEMLPGANITLQSGENLDTTIGLRIKLFIDFGDIRNMALELGIDYNKKPLANIIYQGTVDDNNKENGKVFVDLQGLGLPAITLENINLGGMLLDLLSGLTAGDADVEQGATEVLNEVSKAMNAEDRGIGEGKFDPSEEDWTDQKGLPLLLIMASSKEVSIAVTGALLTSLIRNSSVGISIPELHSIKIGYSEEEDLAGLVVTLTSDEYSQAFKIKLGFGDCFSGFGPHIASSINPFVNSAGDKIEYQDVSVLNKLSLGLDLGLRLTTKKPTGEKSDQVVSLEKLLEGIIGLDRGGINLDLQDSIMQLELKVNAYVDLANIKETALSLELNYKEARLIAIYFYGKTNKVYADLSGLGLFKAQLSGIDIMSLIGDMLGGSGLIEDGVGVDIGGMIGGLLPQESVESARNTRGAIDTNPALLNIIFGNTDIVINPNMSFFGTIFSNLMPDSAFDFNSLPNFTDLRLTVNLMSGLLSNMDLRVKLDYENSLNLFIPEGGFRLKIGAESEEVDIPDDFDEYGGIAGLSLGSKNGALGANISLGALIGSLVDSLKVTDLSIYIDKKNSYWEIKNLTDAAYNENNGFTKPENDGFAGSWHYKIFRRVRLMLNKSNKNSLLVGVDIMTPGASFLDVQGGITAGVAHNSLYIGLQNLILKLGLININLGDMINTFTGSPNISIGTLYLPALENLLGGSEETDVGTVYGKVLDQYGSPVRNARISVNSDKIAETYTDKDGNYSLINVPIGDYKFTVSKDGYRIESEIPVSITSNKNGAIPSVRNFTLNEDVVFNDITIRGKLKLQEWSEKENAYVETTFPNSVYFYTDNVGIESGAYSDLNGAFSISIKEYRSSSLVIKYKIDGYERSFAVSLVRGTQEYEMTRQELGAITVFKNIAVKGQLLLEDKTPLNSGIEPFANQNITVATNGNGYLKNIATDAQGNFSCIIDRTTAPSLTIVNDYNKTEAIRFGEEEAKGKKVIEYNHTVSKFRGLNIDANFAYSHNGQIFGYGGSPIPSQEDYGKLTVEGLSIDNSSQEDGVINFSSDTMELYSGKEYKAIISKIGGGLYYSKTFTVSDNNTFIKVMDNASYNLYSGSVSGVVTLANADGSVNFAKDYIAKMVTNDGSETVVGQGTIGSDGRYNFTFDKVRNSNYKIKIYTPDNQPATSNGSHIQQVIKDIIEAPVFDDSGNVIIGAPKVVECNFGELDFKGSISGNIMTLVGGNKVPATGSYEIWLQIKTSNGSYRTIRSTDSYDGTSQSTAGNFNDHTPRVYNNITDEELKALGKTREQLYVFSNGNFTIKNLDINSTYRVNIRSRDYKNTNATDDCLFTNINTKYTLAQDIVLESRTHWSQTHDVFGSPIAGIRIRLGADILDGDKKDNGHYNDVTNSTENPVYSNRFETGSTDLYDNYIYVEAWLAPTVANGLINTIHGLIAEMLIGYQTISYDQRYELKTFGAFNESNSLRIYDHYYDSQSQYYNAVNALAARLPGGMVFGIIQLVGLRNLLSGVPDFLYNIILNLLQSVLGEQVSGIISHLLPFANPYSLIETREQNGNPLGQLLKDEGINLKTLTDNSGDKQVKLYDRSTYAKITLNSTGDTFLDRITLVLNGASYQHASNDIVSNNNWNPNNTQVLKSKKIIYNSDGTPANEESRLEHLRMQAWERYNVVNTYVVIEESSTLATGGKYISARTYIYDNYGSQQLVEVTDESGNIIAYKGNGNTNGQSMKDDYYTELDIANNGLDLKVVNKVGMMQRVDVVGGSGLVEGTLNGVGIAYAEPTKIIFHDPFDSSDFTAIGGSWASGAGGVRHSSDIGPGEQPIKSVLDILPNRIGATFNDGDASDSDGVYLHWDTSKIPFGDPNGTNRDDDTDDHFIYGYAGNFTISAKYEGDVEVVTQIRVELDPIKVDPLSTYRMDDPDNKKPLFDLPSIDPLTFVKDEHRYDDFGHMLSDAESLKNAKADYIEKYLPSMFIYDYEIQRPSISGGTIPMPKRILFNDLTWNLDGLNFDKAGGISYIDLTYGYKSGTTAPSTSKRASIKVPINIKGRTIIGIDAKVTNSILGLVDGKISFNPLVHEDILDTILNIEKDNQYQVTVRNENGSIFTLPNDKSDETDATEWKISRIDAEELYKYDEFSVEEQVFTVYFIFKASTGDEQRVPITVTVIARKILAYSLPGEESTIYNINDPKNINITPFMNDGLQLPNKIKVYYDNAYTQWEEFDLTKDNYSIPKFDYVFEGATKEYTVNIVLKGIIEQRVPIVYTVNKTQLKSVDHIIVTPYGDTAIPNNPLTNYLNGNDKELKANINAYFAINDANIVEEYSVGDMIKHNNVEYFKDINFINPSFKGASYFVNALFHDEIFGDIVIKNVPLTLKNSLVTSLEMPSYAAINPFDGDNEITKLLQSLDIKLNIFGENMAITQDYFDIIEWKYENNKGFANNGEAQNIVVKIGNNNFNSEDNNIWTQEVLLKLNTINNTANDILINNDEFGNKIDSSKEDNALILEDVYSMEETLPTTVFVRVAGDRIIQVPVSYKFANNNLYESEKVIIENAARVGLNDGHYQYFDVIVYNESYSKVKTVTFLDNNGNPTAYGQDNPIEIYAFDGFTLPVTAKVTLENNNQRAFTIDWTNIETYDHIKEDTVITATAKIGNTEFGYIIWEVYIKVIYEKIIESQIRDVVNIDPYKDVMEQLKEQLGSILEVRTDKRNGAVYVNFELPMVALNINGESIDTQLNVGITNNNTVFRESFPLRVNMFERIAIGIDKEFVGSIYQPIDFSKENEATILFKSGANLTLPVKWDISGLEYTQLGGTYKVKATIDTEIEELRQTIDVLVNIKPSMLEKLYDENQQELSSLTVDPFEGFNDLPNKVFAKFIGSNDLLLLDVDWTISQIANAMSIMGGNFDGKDLPAAIASVYIKRYNGSNFVKVGVQPIEVPVIVSKKEITGIQFSKDNAIYETLTENANGEYNYLMDINPYELTAAYSEKFGEENFAYFNYVKMIINGGEEEKVFKIKADNYSIFDKATNNPTFTGDLYKGRDINVDIRFGVVGQNGITVAKDAFIKAHIDVTILNMTYKKGLEKNDAQEIDGFYNYDIDIYGLTNTRQNVDDFIDGTYNIETETKVLNGVNVIFNKSDINNYFEIRGDKPSLTDRKKGSINYNGGQGRLYAEFGNEFGGKQKVIMLLNYENRKITSIDFSDSDTFKEYTDSKGVKRRQFVFDPFVYNSETSLKTYPNVATVKFANNDQVFTLQTTEWDISNVFFSYYGGDSYAKVIFGKGNAKQTIDSRVRIINRTVDNSRLEGAIREDGGKITVDSEGNISGYTIKPYQYNDVGNIAAEVAKEVFNDIGSWFVVFFREGDPIAYQLGNTVTEARKVIINGDSYQIDMSVNGRINYPIKDSENEMISIFSLDQSRPITSKGGYARFKVTIPSYASGIGDNKKGTQSASFNVPCEEQYIIGYQFQDEDKETFDLWQQYKDSSNPIRYNITSETFTPEGNVYEINNPYVFIKENGVKMPDNIRVYVGKKEDRGTNNFDKSTYSFVTSSYWSNSINGRAQIAYNQKEMNTSFRLELDGQTFNVKFVVNDIDKWTLKDNLLFLEPNTYYSKEQIILLPGSSQVNNNLKSIVSVDGSNNENLTIVFGDTGVVFNNIKGGGSKLNSINKWNFRNVDFDNASSSFLHTATMTLGGRGGQEVKWQFKINDKANTNNTLQELIVLKVGETITLPTKYAQIFSRESNATIKTPNIDIAYGTPENNRDNENTAFTVVQEGNTYKITAKDITNAAADDESKSLPLVIPWSPVGSRAYPGENVKMGGKIVVTAYRESDFTDVKSLVKFYHPDAPNAYKSVLIGVPSTWTYPSEMPATAGSDGGAQSSIGLDTSLVQKETPPIIVMEDSKFSAKYLPNIKIGDIVIAAPWDKAKVWWTPNPYISGVWDPSINNFGTELSGGLSAINTGRDTNASRAGGRYTIVTNININGAQRRIYIALDIVSKGF